MIYRWRNWNLWRIRDLPKPISKVQEWDLNSGLPSPELLSDTPERAVEKVEGRARHTSALRRNSTMQRGAKVSLQLSHHPKHWALQYRMLWNLMCNATSYKGIFILYVIPVWQHILTDSWSLESSQGVWCCSIRKSNFSKPSWTTKILAWIWVRAL